MAELLIAALYKFVSVAEPESLRTDLERSCRRFGLRGTLLVAEEGLNGTLAGRPGDLRQMLAELRKDPRFADLEHKESHAEEWPFQRLKVRVKPEIVTMGVPGIDPASDAGTYVQPKEWNALITDPEVLVVDTRNDYEVSIGTFAGAVDPGLSGFRDFPGWAKRNLPSEDRHRKVAMFCTGGIRCEKSTAFLKTQGFDEVYHLEGGILKYLETVPQDESLWRGECFVFDERVSVDHSLEPGAYDLCELCGRPVVRGSDAEACVCRSVA